MSHIASSRQRQSWGRRALGLFAAVWLNLALQPCAMAYEVDDHDCPHCPPAETHNHGDRHDGMGYEMPCADGAADCSIDPDWSHDARGAKSKLKDAPTDSSAAIIAFGFEARRVHHVAPTPERPPLSVRAGAPPPLHVLYCVYLD